jgi:hypothetical protein
MKECFEQLRSAWIMVYVLRAVKTLIRCYQAIQYNHNILFHRNYIFSGTFMADNENLLGPFRNRHLALEV